MTEDDTATISSRHGGRARTVDVAPHLFLVLDARFPACHATRVCLAGLDEVTIGRGPAASFTRSAGTRRLDIVLPDRWLSGRHARWSRVLKQWTFEDLGSKNGSIVNGTACDRAELDDGDLIELGRTFLIYRTCPRDETKPEVFEVAHAPAARGDLRTLLPELASAHVRLAQIAASNVSVLLSGETGTGKEVLARAIHALSGRRGAFVGVNCAALPGDLVVAELSGHRKGAFSGATSDQPGLVVAADGGTLFLDEIGDMPLASQATLLRILQEQEVRPVGATRSVQVDVRVVTATNRSLDAMVDAGTFRADLLARISGFRFAAPPLRARREDIGLLAADLLARHAPLGETPPPLTATAARALLAHDWPGNVRALEKCLETARVLASAAAARVIDLEHLPLAVQQALAEPGDAQRAELEALLVEHHGNIAAVARATGKARMQIQRWVKRWSFDLEHYRRR